MLIKLLLMFYLMFKLFYFLDNIFKKYILFINFYDLIINLIFFIILQFYDLINY